MKKHLAIVILLATLVSTLFAGLRPIKLTDAWKSKIRKLAPAKATAKPAKDRKVLLFSLSPGFKHWCIPHTAAVVKILGEKSGAFKVTMSKDVQMFTPENLKQFDAVILNNTCTRNPTRNIFIDALGKDKKDEAAALEKSLLDFVKNGGGLAGIHGAIVFLNNSPEFSELLGGSFAFHPSQQEVTLKLVEPDHPILKGFGGKPFVHIDEPYIFKNAYTKKNFRPLLEMDTSLLKCGKAQKKVASDVRYTAWVKKYGKGRVFYCSTSHNAQSFEKPELLQFLLAGIQYTLGDLKCDDTPKKAEKAEK
jgi:type 1 glutamine amidotransferase